AASPARPSALRPAAASVPLLRPRPSIVNLAMSRLVHRVRAVRFGDETHFEDGTLTVDRNHISGFFDSPALAEVRLAWASPGDPVRIVKVLDAVEPRTRAAAGGGPFPGWLSPARGDGGGDTHVLRGAAVVVAGFLPRAQEAVVDMS